MAGNSPSPDFQWGMSWPLASFRGWPKGSSGRCRDVQGYGLLPTLTTGCSGGDPDTLTKAVEVIRQFNITINDEKSILKPTQDLINLGFRINTHKLTIKLQLSTFDKLFFLLRLTKQGTVKDRRRIHGFASWILYNLRLPSFLAKDILRGDPSWLQAALKDLNVLEPKELLNPPLAMNLFTDATPWCLAAIIPSRNAHFAQAFQHRTEINQAELTAAIKGLMWAATLVSDTHITLYVDNASTFCALRSGAGRTLRRHDL